MADTNRLHSVNTSRVLRAIRQNPGISRIKVAELLDLDRSTVTKIMQVILDRALVRTVGKNTTQSGVGRRQINLEINTEIGVVLGIEIQEKIYRAVLCDLEGNLADSMEGPFTVSSKTLDAELAKIVADARRRSGEAGKLLLGVGIGIPGIIDPYTGTIVRSFPFCIDEPCSLSKRLQSLFPEPVFIENDANCCCWAEMAFRPGDINRNFVAVLGEFRENVWPSKGTGLAVGLGLVIRSRVLHGDHFTTGEFRSLYAAKNDPQFRASRKNVSSLPENTLLLRQIYKELTDNLGFMINCFDLNKVVFAGDLPEHRENLEEAMAASLDKNLVYCSQRTEPVPVEFSPFGKNSVSMGAAGMFIEKLFTVPDMADHFQELVGYDLFERIFRLHTL